MAVTTKSVDLPHWDMTVVFQGLDAPEFDREFTGVVEAIGGLKKLFDDQGIRKSDHLEVNDALVSSFETVLRTLNELLERTKTLGAFISSFVSTDSRNDVAQAKMSELQVEMVELSKLATRLNAWIGSLDVEKLIEVSAPAREHAYALRKAHRQASHLMSEEEEDLAASLNLTGGQAWGKLHRNLTSQLSVVVEKPDGAEELPMSAVRGLAHDADPAVRKAAYEAELAKWEESAVPLAASLNSIKGERNILNARRGWKDSLEPALFANNVDRQTLDAMQKAVVDSFPHFRRYLKAKAKLLGKESLPFFDLFAPVGEETDEWDWTRATQFVVEQFGTYSSGLAAMADRSFKERWVDAEPRAGKSDGAFCMGLRKDESRVLTNFTGSFNSVQTLAHELGHAYHNVNLASRTPVQRDTPMALAETASIFCQTIIVQAGLASAPEGEKIAILENDLQSNFQVVVDIHSRFLFEKSVFEGRARRELSVEELNDLMLEAQEQTYGDGLDPKLRHPYMWAVKPHYYGASYYNWPYTFGLLFGLGLYSQYEADAEKFRAGYDDLLASTGQDDAATLASRFGIDVRSSDFWRSSLDVIVRRIDEFERLAAG